MPQQLPPAASRYARAQRAEIAAATAAAARLWRRMGEDFDTSYLALEPALLEVVESAQVRVARDAQQYIPEVTGQVGGRVRAREYDLLPDAWAGTAGDGRAVSGLMYGGVTTAKAAVRDGASAGAALTMGGRFLSQAVPTLLSDTARSVEHVEAKSRHVGTFVRMLNPPSCGRCVILAGRTYGSSQAFERHPNCDCRHIPAPESVAGDLVVDPHEYLDGLSDKDLARTLGSKANAQAWRDGADVNQVINAYRRGGDVRKAQVYGRSIKYTTEGVTRRGWAGQSMRRSGAFRAAEQKIGRDARLRAPRLMPSSIYEIATDRADARRLLQLYGWIL